MSVLSEGTDDGVTWTCSRDGTEIDLDHFYDIQVHVWGHDDEVESIEDAALRLYPPQDGDYPGVDRNAEARAAYIRGRRGES